MLRFKDKLPYFLCYLTAFVAGIKQLREPDIWWQLLSGRWMLENRQVTHRDIFSYTMEGRPWINVKWLYEILIATLEKITGPLGVSLLQGIVNVIIVFLLFKCLAVLGKHLQQGVSRFFSVLAAVLFLAVVEYRMAGRPEMISHLMCVLFLFVLLRSPKPEWKNIVWLVPLQCLWANIHEGYPVGLVLIGSFVAGNLLVWILNKDKTYFQYALRILVVFVLAVLALLVNPNGIQLWKQPFEIYRQVWANKYTTELYSFYVPEYWTLQAKIHVALLASVILFWVFRMVRDVKNKRTSLFYTPTFVSYFLLIILFGYLSLTANRNIPFAQIVLFPSIPIMLTYLVASVKPGKFKWYGILQKQSSWLAAIIVIGFYISIINNSYYKLTKSVNKYGLHISYFHTPFGSANYIKQYQLKGPAFSDYFISSYMLWALYPDFKSYIDLRDLDVFPVPFFEQYFELYKDKKKFADLDHKYNFNYVVISTSQLIGLQRDLYWLPGYNMIYVDPVAAIFLKQTKENMYMNDNAQVQKPFTWPTAPEEPNWASFITKLLNPNYANPGEDEKYEPVYEALFNNQMMNYPGAVKALRTKLSNFEDEAMPYITLGNIYAEYAKVIEDSTLKHKLIDSANMYMQRAKDMK